ncbi:MAG: AAA family ATPase [Bacteroidales bacterium]|nr:AAA family ATPase [Bacteroidales bacterium]MDT8432766.1 AAA family ATPase [Bacteroidales bacterium]
MFKRDILEELTKWKGKKFRKPLVIRGARQVGKTTAVHLFSDQFDQYIYLNLEKEEERIIFEQNYPFPDLVTNLFIYSGKRRDGGETLIFIDEIQNSPKAVALLRYFYEEANELFVITAGSLLESIMDRKISFPVGRVEYMAIYPASFREFLYATDHEQLTAELEKPEVPSFLNNQLTALFRKYATIGGMPEILKHYASGTDISSLNTVYDSLIQSFSDDVEKYSSSSQAQYIRHIITHAFAEGGTKITFQKFGDSDYRSREMKEAFLSLEKTMLIQMVYPCTSTEVPAIPSLTRKPRLHVVDTGLINHARGLLGELVFTENIGDTHRGIIAEHITGQELLASKFSISNKLNFWIREKKESDAEVDYVLSWQGKLIPVEVKSGSVGKLRSLHQFMDRTPHDIAVRIYQGEYLVQKARTIAGKEFTLLNLPFYFVHRIEQEVDKLVT